MNTKEKLLNWRIQEDNSSVTIGFDKIIDAKKESKESNQTELLYLKISGSEKGTVFAFCGGNINDNFITKNHKIKN